MLRGKSELFFTMSQCTHLFNSTPGEQQQTSGSPPPSSSSAGGRHLGFIDAVSPWCPFVLLTTLYLLWEHLSPTDIVEREPRIFLFSMGVLFSNITVS